MAAIFLKRIINTLEDYGREDITEFRVIKQEQKRAPSPFEVLADRDEIELQSHVPPPQTTLSPNQSSVNSQVQIIYDSEVDTAIDGATTGLGVIEANLSFGLISSGSHSQIPEDEHLFQSLSTQLHASGSHSDASSSFQNSYDSTQEIGEIEADAELDQSEVYLTENFQFKVEPVQRLSPLTHEEFQNFFDPDGRLVNEHGFKKCIFKGGVDPDIRRDVWKFLFGLYPPKTTTRERDIIKARNHIQYEALKTRWYHELKQLCKSDPKSVKFCPDWYSGCGKRPPSRHDVDVPSNPDVYDNFLGDNEQESAVDYLSTGNPESSRKFIDPLLSELDTESQSKNFDSGFEGTPEDVQAKRSSGEIVTPSNLSSGAENASPSLAYDALFGKGSSGEIATLSNVAENESPSSAYDALFGKDNSGKIVIASNFSSGAESTSPSLAYDALFGKDSSGEIVIQNNLSSGAENASPSSSYKALFGNDSNEEIAPLNSFILPSENTSPSSTYDGLFPELDTSVDTNSDLLCKLENNPSEEKDVSEALRDAMREEGDNASASKNSEPFDDSGEDVTPFGSFSEVLETMCTEPVKLTRNYTISETLLDWELFQGEHADQSVEATCSEEIDENLVDIGEDRITGNVVSEVETTCNEHVFEITDTDSELLPENLGFIGSNLIGNRSQSQDILDLNDLADDKSNSHVVLETRDDNSNVLVEGKIRVDVNTISSPYISGIEKELCSSDSAHEDGPSIEMYQSQLLAEELGVEETFLQTSPSVVDRVSSPDGGDESCPDEHAPHSEYQETVDATEVEKESLFQESCKRATSASVGSTSDASKLLPDNIDKNGHKKPRDEKLNLTSVPHWIAQIVHASIPAGPRSSKYGQGEVVEHVGHSVRTGEGSAVHLESQATSIPYTLTYPYTISTSSSTQLGKTSQTFVSPSCCGELDETVVEDDCVATVIDEATDREFSEELTRILTSRGIEGLTAALELHANLKRPDTNKRRTVGNKLKETVNNDFISQQLWASLTNSTSEGDTWGRQMIHFSSHPSSPIYDFETPVLQASNGEQCPYCNKRNQVMISVSSTFGCDLLKSLELEAQLVAARQRYNPVTMLDAVRIIDKDIPRTDRELDFFSGDDNKHLLMLRDALITYAFFHPDVGYAQGMNDIMSQFLVVLNSEADAYWMFCCYMDHFKANFMEEGMLKKISMVDQLLMKMDRQLYDFLQERDMDLMFCHRWLLLCFKREFPHEDALILFEVISSHYLEVFSLEAEMERYKERAKELERNEGNRTEEVDSTPEYSFDVFVCVTMLHEYRDLIMQHDEFVDIYRAVLSLPQGLDVTVILIKAEELFYRFCRKSITDSFQVINKEELPEKPATGIDLSKLAIKR